MYNWSGFLEYDCGDYEKFIDEAILLAIFLNAVGYKTFMKQIFIIKFYCFTKSLEEFIVVLIIFRGNLIQILALTAFSGCNTLKDFEK